MQQLAKNDRGWNCSIFHWSCSSLFRELPLSPAVPPAAGNYNSHETATALTVNINMASVSQTKANQFLPWNEIKLGQGSGRVGHRPVSLLHFWWRGLKGTAARREHCQFSWINAAVHGGPARAESGKSQMQNYKKGVIDLSRSGDMRHACTCMWHFGLKWARFDCWFACKSHLPEYLGGMGV